MPNSVQLGVNSEGYRNGYGCIIMKDEAEATRAAAEMDKRYIKTNNMTRWVDTSVISYNEWVHFNDLRGGFGRPEQFRKNPGYVEGVNRDSGSYDKTDAMAKTAKLFDLVDEENVEQSLTLRGLPHYASKQDI